MNNNIIIIDDDEINNFVCSKIIKCISTEIQVQCFSSSVEAFSEISLQDIPPSTIVLLDLNMPKLDGWQFLKKIKEKNITCRVFILSSTLDPLDMEKAKNNADVKEFISKPLSHDKIKEILNTD